MLGLKCRVPNTELVAALMAQKLLAVGAGDNVVRFLPPLNIEDAQIDEAIELLDAACHALKDAPDRAGGA